MNRWINVTSFVHVYVVMGTTTSSAPSQCRAPADPKIHQDVVVFVSEFATSGKLQGVWLWISVISTLRLWVLGASSFFKQLLFSFSVFDFEAKVFDHL